MRLLPIRARALRLMFATVVVVAVSISAAACGPMRDAGVSGSTPDSTAVRPDSANGNVASADVSHAKLFGSARQASAGTDSTAKKSANAKDSTIVKLLKSRTPKDSFSLLA